jgi:hypothetical protein
MRRWRDLATLGVATAALGGLVPAGAWAVPGSGPREVVDSVFTTTRPGAPSGSIYDVTYRNPSDPSKNPPAVRTVILTSPPGTRIDTAVPARCPASDFELQTRGDAACPARSKIGSGTVTTSVLGGPPSTSQISVFNTAGGLIQLVKSGPFGVAVVRSRFHHGSFRTEIPTCITGGQPPRGCPFDQAVLLASRIVIKKITVGDRSYATTPRTCPATGWPTRITYRYADGAVESVVSTSRCRKASGGGRCQLRCPRPGGDQDRPDDPEDRSIVR